MVPGKPNEALLMILVNLGVLGDGEWDVEMGMGMATTSMTKPVTTTMCMTNIVATTTSMANRRVTRTASALLVLYTHPDGHLTTRD